MSLIPVPSILSVVIVVFPRVYLKSSGKQNWFMWKRRYTPLKKEHKQCESITTRQNSCIDLVPWTHKGNINILSGKNIETYTYIYKCVCVHVQDRSTERHIKQSNMSDKNLVNDSHHCSIKIREFITC